MSSSHRFPQWRLGLVIGLAAIGLSCAIYLTSHFYELREGAASFHSICNIGETMNCDKVAASRYAELFAGLPLSSVAAGWYLMLILSSLVALNRSWRRDALRVLAGLSAIAAGVSVVYALIMVAVIKTSCLFCWIGHGVDWAIFATVMSLKPGISGRALRAEPANREYLQWILGGSTVTLVLTVFFLAQGFSKVAPVQDAELMIQAVLTGPKLSVSVPPHAPTVEGNADAPITIVEFSDFQCPACRVGAKLVHGLAMRYPDKVRVVMRNFPLDPRCNRMMQNGGHEYACEAAAIGLCAQKMGKFKPVYETFFDRQEEMTTQTPKGLAKAAGLDMAQLEACINSDEIKKAVAEDIEEGITLSIHSTPTFFINGQRQEGPLPVGIWSRLIDRL